MAQNWELRTDTGNFSFLPFLQLIASLSRENSFLIPSVTFQGYFSYTQANIKVLLAFIHVAAEYV